MAYPVSLDTFTTLVDNSDAIIAAHMNDRGTAIAATEVKLGIDSSAVATSHDYLLTHLPAQAANWDAGAVEVRAQTFESDIVTGTAPFTIASTTVVANLNAEMVGGTALTGLQTKLTNSAGLLAALSDETGTGLAVFNTTPTLVTPVLGVATATSINKVTITAPAASATLTIANTKTLTVTGDATISATPYTPSGTDVAVADGGTGASTAAVGLNNLLPSQTGNAGKVLTTDASNASWQTAGFGAWATVNNNQVYQVSTDGFVLAYTQVAGIIYGYTDSSNPPTTLRANQETASSNRAHIMFPVRKNDYYKTTGAATVYWLPMGA